MSEGARDLVDQERPGDGQWNQREGKRDDATGVLQEQQPETERDIMRSLSNNYDDGHGNVTKQWLK